MASDSTLAPDSDPKIPDPKIPKILGTKRDFNNLRAWLDEIDENLEDVQSGTGFFTILEESLTDSVESSQPEQG